VSAFTKKPIVMNPIRLRSAVVLWLGILLLAWGLVSPPAHAASARKQCLKDSCTPQRSLCASDSKEQFRAAKASCSSKRCKREAKRTFKKTKKACSAALTACKRCCKKDPGPACAGDAGGGVADNEVGRLVAAKVIQILDESFFTPFQVDDLFTMFARFAPPPVELPPAEVVAGCTVRTSSSGGMPPPSVPPATLDAGSPVTVTTGVARAELTLDSAAAPSMVPAQTPHQLFAAGFDAGQNLTAQIPGGVDIGAFSVSATVPAELVVTEPPLMQAGATLPLTGPLRLIWTGADSTGTVDVGLNAGALPPIGPSSDGAERLITTVVCSFPDTGEATIPGEVMNRLPPDANVLGLRMDRARVVRVPAPLTDGSDGTFAFWTLSSFSWLSDQVEVLLP